MQEEIKITAKSSPEALPNIPIEVHQIIASNQKSEVTKIGLLPIDGMPSFIQEYITTCSEIFNTPRDYWAGATIMATALAIGDKIELLTKYDNVPILWMNLIGDVSSGKTEAMNFSLNPFEELDSISSEKFKSDYLQYEEMEKLDKKTKKEKGIDKLTKPTVFQYIVKDSTPEALTQIHNINQRGIMIARDELKGWIDDFGRYSKSGEQSNMLSSYNRIRMVTNRKGGGIDCLLDIPKPFICVFGGMQPDLIPTLAEDSRKENGFLARFCNVWPDHSEKPMYNKNIVPDELKIRWKEFITILTKISKVINVRLSEKAECLYEDWFNKNVEISNCEDSGYLKGVYGKLDIIALRLAIVIYGMNLSNNYETNQQINADEMKAALDLTEYFRATGLKVYHKLFDTNSNLNLKEVIKFLAQLGNSQTQIAEILKVSQPYVCKVLKSI